MKGDRKEFSKWPTCLNVALCLIGLGLMVAFIVPGKLRLKVFANKILSREVSQSEKLRNKGQAFDQEYH